MFPSPAEIWLALREPLTTNELERLFGVEQKHAYGFRKKMYKYSGTDGLFSKEYGTDGIVYARSMAAVYFIKEVRQRNVTVSEIATRYSLPEYRVAKMISRIMRFGLIE